MLKNGNHQATLFRGGGETFKKLVRQEIQDFCSLFLMEGFQPHTKGRGANHILRGGLTTTFATH